MKTLRKKQLPHAALLVACTLVAGCAVAPRPHGVFLDPVASARDPGSSIAGLAQEGWIRGDHDSSWLLLDLSVRNRVHQICRLSPDSLDAVLVSDPDRTYPSYRTVLRPRDFWEHHAMLIEHARRKHDPENPHRPDVIGLAVHKALDLPEYQAREKELFETRRAQVQWDKEHGGQVDVGDSALMAWRRRGLRDTLIDPGREARMLFVLPVDTCDGRLVVRLRFCGVQDSVVLRQRREGL